MLNDIKKKGMQNKNKKGFIEMVGIPEALYADSDQDVPSKVCNKPKPQSKSPMRAEKKV